MGLLSDVRVGFLNRVVQEHVLVFITPDVDGVCAWRILRHLFRQIQALYTLIVISDKNQLREQYSANKDKFDYVVLVNCGANFDVIETLDAPSQAIFFVCDSHRPIHVNNYYNQRQVQLITLNENTDEIPKFEDIYNDDLTDNSEEEEGDEEEEAEGGRGRDRSKLRSAEKRISRRRWERRKEELLVEYESFSFHTTASAVVLFDVAWKFSQDNLNLLWCAIVGHVSQLMLYRANRDHYIEQIDNLHSHVNRLSHVNQVMDSSASNNSSSQSGTSITFGEELALWLYRHWSLKEAIEATMLTSTRFKLFTEGGYRRMQEFLASIGLPQRDCAQRYSSMNPQIRHNLDSLFLQYGEQFGFTRLELFVPSFTMRLSYKTPLSALDSFWLIFSALECHSSKDPVECFHTAAEILGSWSMDSLEGWMENMQSQLQCLVKQVRALLDTDEVVAFGPFLYVYVARSSLLSLNFRNPQFVGLLARYLLTAKAAIRKKMGRNKRVSQMPLVLCVDSKYEENHLYLIGIPPLQGDDDRNLFGQAFEAAVKRTNSRAQFRHFDSNCIELHREDMLKFFEALAALLSS